MFVSTQRRKSKAFRVLFELNIILLRAKDRFQYIGEFFKYSAGQEFGSSLLAGQKQTERAKAQIQNFWRKKEMFKKFGRISDFNGKSSQNCHHHDRSSLKSVWTESICNASSTSLRKNCNSCIKSRIQGKWNSLQSDSIYKSERKTSQSSPCWKVWSYASKKLLRSLLCAFIIQRAFGVPSKRSIENLHAESLACLCQCRLLSAQQKADVVKQSFGWTATSWRCWAELSETESGIHAAYLAFVFFVSGHSLEYICL